MCFPKFHISTIPYKIEPLRNLKKLPIAATSDPNNICLLWIGGLKLLATIEVMKAWGFTYKTILLVWCKKTKKYLPTNGLRYWTRASTGLLLMGSKGSIASFKSHHLSVN